MTRLNVGKRISRERFMTGLKAGELRGAELENHLFTSSQRKQAMLKKMTITPCLVLMGGTRTVVILGTDPAATEIAIQTLCAEMVAKIFGAQIDRLTVASMIRTDTSNMGLISSFWETFRMSQDRYEIDPFDLYAAQTGVCLLETGIAGSKIQDVIQEMVMDICLAIGEEMGKSVEDRTQTFNRIQETMYARLDHHLVRHLPLRGGIATEWRFEQRDIRRVWEERAEEADRDFSHEPALTR